MSLPAVAATRLPGFALLAARLSGQVLATGKLPDDVVDMVVLTTGTHAYRRADGVAVIPLALGT